MSIDPTEVTVRELTKGYKDNDEGGVVGYDGQLDIRPPYQREFVYGEKERHAVIDTLIKGYPLNVMYWAVRDSIGDTDERVFEIMDGQQRTISICQFVDSEFSFNGRYFHNLQKDEKEAILDYKLTVYRCSGPDSEKLEWFKTINIAGAELSTQELRNAVYSGPWVTDAKRYFSRRSCAAHGLAEDLMAGNYIRQKYLETVIKWINDGDIEGYMAKQQLKPNANELWLYFTSVVTWVRTTFPTYRSQMKGVPWGMLYNQFKDDELDPVKLEERISGYMADEDVTRKPGIYAYVLDGNEKHLNIRQFTPNMRVEAYERQKGLCARGSKCKDPENTDGSKVFKIEQMEADHITPWHEGGKTEAGNCQMLCVLDNRSKGGN